MVSFEEMLKCLYVPLPDDRTEINKKFTTTTCQKITPEVLELDQSQMLPNRDILEDESGQASLDSLKIKS